MADEKSLVFKLDAGTALIQMQALSVAINDTKTALKTMKSQGLDESDKGFLEQAVNLKALQKEYNTLNTVVVNQKVAQNELTDTTYANIKADKAQNNSIAENRKAYNALYAQITQMPRATEAQRKAMEDAQKTAKRLSDVLKEQESAIGDNRRNVGNYSEAFKGAFSTIGNGIPMLGAFSTAQKGVNAAMAANPAGAIVFALQALFQVLQSNAEWADKFSFALDSVNNVMRIIADVVGDLVSNGLEKLKNFFSNFQENLKQVGQILVDNVINRFKSFGVIAESIALALDGNFKEAAKKATDGVIQLGTGVTNATDKIGRGVNAVKEFGKSLADAAKDGYNAAEALDNMTVELAKLNGQNKIAETQIKRLMVQLKDRTQSEEERAKIAEKIAQKEIDQFNTSVKIAQQELAITKAKLKDKKLSGEEEADIIDKQIALEDALISAKQSSADKQSRINGLLRETQDKAVEEQKKATEDYLKSLSQLEDEFYLDQRGKLAKSFDDKLEAIKGNSQQEIALRTAIEKAREDALAKLDKDANDKRIAKEVADKSAEINREITHLNALRDHELAQAELLVASDEEKKRKRLEISLSYLEQQLVLAEKLANVDNDVTQQELDNIQKIQDSISAFKNNLEQNPPKSIAESLGLTQEDIEKAQQGLGVMMEAVQSISTIINGVYEQRIDNINTERDAEISAISESTLSEEEKKKRISQANKKAAQETYELQKKQFEINKAVSIVQAVIATAQAVIAQIANPTPYVGFALAAIAAATGAAQIALIASQKPPPPPKFSRGGILVGKSHENGGIPIKLASGGFVEAEGGEVIINKRSSSLFRDKLSAINSYGGYGTKFATGGILGDGGLSQRSLTQTESFNAQVIADAIARMPAPVLSITDLSAAQSSRQRSIDIAG